MSMANKLRLLTDGNVVEIGDNLIAVGTANKGYAIYSGTERYDNKFSSCTKWGKLYILKSYGVSAHEITYSIIKGNEYRENLSKEDLIDELFELYNEKVIRILGNKLGYTKKIGNFSVVALTTDYITYSAVYNSSGQRIIDATPMDIMHCCNKNKDRLVIDVSKLHRLTSMVQSIKWDIRVDKSLLDKAREYKVICIDEAGNLVHGHMSRSVPDCDGINKCIKNIEKS